MGDFSSNIPGKFSKIIENVFPQKSTFFEGKPIFLRPETDSPRPEVFFPAGKSHISKCSWVYDFYVFRIIEQVRNFVFSDINTLKSCPYMPYQDPTKPYVNYWFASSERFF